MSPGKRWGVSEDDRAWAHSMEGEFVCGIDGCPYRFEGTIGEWLELRESHRKERHPDYREPKRRRRSYPVSNPGGTE